MKILALDTATPACSVALQVAGQVTSVHQIIPRQQSEQVLVQVDQLLQAAGVSLSELDVIACGIGPGSFMGCRLAVSVAQGLAFGAGLPVLSVSTLQVLAQSQDASSVCAAWDARMGQLYLGSYQRQRNGVMQLIGQEHLLSPESVCLEKCPVAAVGNAWAVYADQLPDGLISGFERVVTDTYPHAESMLAIAEAAPQSLYCTPDQVAPTYLRRPVND